jgi:hypothetical protein
VDDSCETKMPHVYFLKYVCLLERFYRVCQGHESFHK